MRTIPWPKVYHGPSRARYYAKINEKTSNIIGNLAYHVRADGTVEATAVHQKKTAAFSSGRCHPVEK